MKNLNMIGTKIKFIREDRKITQDYMAGKLGISQTAYSKIENNQTQLTIDRLKEIAEVLEVPEIELINGSPINQFNIEKVEKNYAYINTFIESQKELYDKLLDEKENQIKLLREIINELKSK